MKLKLFFVTLITVALGLVQANATKIRVVTTLTDLADLTRNVGGDFVEVRSLATGIEEIGRAHV